MKAVLWILFSFVLGFAGAIVCTLRDWPGAQALGLVSLYFAVVFAYGAWQRRSRP